MTDKELVIRDTRNGDWLWLSKAAVNHIQKEIKEPSSYIAVYVQLCFYANYNTHECYPSRSTISKKLNLSERYITTVLKGLEGIKLINVSREKGQKNVYTLLSLSSASQFTSEPTTPGVVNPQHEVTSEPTTPVNILSTKESKEREDSSPKGDPSSLPKKKTLPTLYCEAYELHFKFKPFLNAEGKIHMPMKEIMALNRLKSSISEEKVREILTPDTEGRIPVFNDDRIMQDKWVQKRLYFPSVLIDRITEINHATAMEVNNGSSR